MWVRSQKQFWGNFHPGRIGGLYLLRKGLRGLDTNTRCWFSNMFWDIFTPKLGGNPSDLTCASYFFEKIGGEKPPTGKITHPEDHLTLLCSRVWTCIIAGFQPPRIPKPPWPRWIICYDFKSGWCSWPITPTRPEHNLCNRSSLSISEWYCWWMKSCTSW